MQCFKRCAALILGFAVLSGASLAMVLLAAPRWLAAADAPGPADAIVVLSGDYRRLYEGAELYKAGHARRIIGTREIRNPTIQVLEAEGMSFPLHENIVRTLLTGKGVPGEAIGFVGRDVVSTAHEAAALAEAFPSPGIRLLVVTSPYHVRRTRMILSDALPHAKLAVVANRFETLPDAWWRDQAAARNIVLEFAKTAWYLLGGRFYRLQP
jgi:uncharacterized SAM-binding protein YcdF (DUF218 family)